MKILITADPFIPVPPIHYGGIERIIDMIICEFIRQGHEVILIAHKDSKPKEGCKLIAYTSDKDLPFKNAILILKTYLKYRPDVVHSFSRLIYLLPLLPLKVKKIMTYQREPTLSQISKAVKISSNGSLIFTGCSSYISNQISKVAESYTVYNGIPIRLFDYVPVVPEDAALVFLGRVEEIKGAHIAIEIAKKTNKRLLIAGNIPEEHVEYFNIKIKPELNEQIVYVGPVNDKQKNELLKNALAFLMPILWNEPFGIVMAEAMACGTPVVGFARGAVPEVIEHGVTGFSCNSIDEMIHSVNNIHSIERSLVRRAAEIRFSSDVISKRYIELYKNDI